MLSSDTFPLLLLLVAMTTVFHYHCTKRTASTTQYQMYDGDILRHLHNFYARSNSIIRKFHHCSVGVKLRLFHAYCCTTYCCQLWVYFNKGSYLKTKVAYNNIHRRILGYNRRDSASSMFANNAIDTFNALLRKNI